MPYDQEAADKIEAGSYLLGRVEKYFKRALGATSYIQEPAVPRIQIDARMRIYYNPEAVRDWTVAETAQAIGHEIEHPIRRHFKRLKDLSDKDAAAIAADLEINYNRQGLPEPHVRPSQYGLPDGRLAEEYYPELVQQRAKPEPQTGNGDGSGKPSGDPHGSPQPTDKPANSQAPAPPDCGSGADGIKRDYERPTDGSPDPETGLPTPQGIDESEVELIRHATAQAIRAEASRGNVPDHWRRWAEEAERDHPTDWRKVLATAIRRAHAVVAGNVDYSRRRPSRHSAFHPQVILPGMVRPVPNVAVVLDTSGSVGAQELKIACAEVDGILDALGHREPIPVLAVDAEVHSVQRTSAGRQIVPTGGGGTDMRIGIEAAAKLKPRADLIIVLTDMYTPWPVTAPKGVKVIAVAIGHPADTTRYPGSPPAWLKVIPAPIKRQ